MARPERVPGTASDDLRNSEELGLEQFGAIPDDHGVSLEELSRAYAELISAGEDPYQAAPEKKVVPAEPAELPALEELTEEPASDEACAISPRSILEAMLFVGHPDNRPLESHEVAALMRGVRPAEIDEMVQELSALYEAEGCPYCIRSVGAGYRMELRREFYPLRDKFYGRVKAARLSQTVVDVLAIVAYNQPIRAEEIDRLRGRPSGGVLNQLVRRQLVEVERVVLDGKKVKQYTTTTRFLELFGLESLDELPQSQDVEREL